MKLAWASLNLLNFWLPRQPTTIRRCEPVGYDLYKRLCPVYTSAQVIFTRAMQESGSTNGLAVLTMRGCGPETYLRGFSPDSTSYPENDDRAFLPGGCLHGIECHVTPPTESYLPTAPTNAPTGADTSAGVVGFPRIGPDFKPNRWRAALQCAREERNRRLIVYTSLGPNCAPDQS